MKIKLQLVDILLEFFPGVYDKYVWYKGKQNIFCVRILKALYGILVSWILYYKNSKKDIESIEFEVNRYGICVANLMKSNKQQAVTWHVNDLKYIHVDPKINDKSAEWLK